MRNWTEAAAALALVAACTAAASAQRVETIGLTAGGGVARFTTHARDSAIGYRAAWNAGVYATMPLGGGFTLQPELVFSQKGAVEEIVLQTLERTIERTYSARYIELPLLVRYDLPLAAVVSPFVLAGLAPAYLVQATNVAGDATPEDMTEQLGRFDVGAVLGAGARYRTPFGTAQLHARAGFSLHDIDESGTPAGLGLASANRNLGFGVVLGFEVAAPF